MIEIRYKPTGEILEQGDWRLDNIYVSINLPHRLILWTQDENDNGMLEDFIDDRPVDLEVKD
jgi:hypothetical protein